MPKFASLALFLSSSVLLPLPAATVVRGTADRGRAVLQNQGCVKCHAIAGTGSSVSATALLKPLAREYTPAGLTATLWNHAPRMWSAMASAGIPAPRLSEQDSADVFAFFASLRYFEPMGDAGRGARTFNSKGCTDCHAKAGGESKALPVDRWQTPTDPIALVGAMWNHVPRMNAEMAKKNRKWPELTSRDLSDIVLYARSFPAQRNQQIQMDMPPLEGGDSVVEAAGCNTCHKEALGFGRQMSERTLTDIAAAMWNHAPKMMQNPSPISTEEMRKVLGAIWSKQFVRPVGDSAKGRKVAETKKCVACHESGPGPRFNKLSGSYSVLRLTSALWGHGDSMLSQMKAKGISWPRMTTSDVENLIAYIDSGRTPK